MHRIDGPGATVDNKFTDGDPAGGVQATVVTDDWMNDVQENIMAVLASGAINPTKGRAADLLDAIKKVATSQGLVKTVKRQVFTASGTYTPSPGMVFCDVEMVGGGGGGGGAAGGAGSAAGGGGGAGGYCRAILTAAQISAAKAVTIGTAGSAGPSSNTAGGAGGNTILAGLLTANGGTGGGGSPTITGATTTSTGGAGGTATGGDINVQGANGFPGFCYAAGVGGYSGQGGGSPFGAGGYPAGPAASGIAGTGKGSGGSGGAANTVGAVGGAGNLGFVSVTEYCTQ